VSATKLRLRPLGLGDEAAFVAAHGAMAAEGFTFGHGYEPGMSWSEYLRRLQYWRLGVDLPGDVVPTTFLAATVAAVIVGRASIRHALNDFLEREGGHIGYCVTPEHRRQGYATEILRQSLVIARAVGVERVLVTCDDDNVGSAAIIERCGGAFDSLVDSAEGGSPKRRYWID
jgi:predicted acetyltransferase